MIGEIKGIISIIITIIDVHTIVEADHGINKFQIADLSMLILNSNTIEGIHGKIEAPQTEMDQIEEVHQITIEEII